LRRELCTRGWARQRRNRRRLSPPLGNNACCRREPHSRRSSLARSQVQSARQIRTAHQRISSRAGTAGLRQWPWMDVSPKRRARGPSGRGGGPAPPRSRRWPGHRLFAALQGSPLGSWLLPMVGLGAAASYDAAGGVGLAAAAAERRGVYQRERSFAKFTGGAPGDRSTKRPTGRRRKAKSAWLDPLE
jgi:hypothetical protein